MLQTDPAFLRQPKKDNSVLMFGTQKWMRPDVLLAARKIMREFDAPEILELLGQPTPPAVLGQKLVSSDALLLADWRPFVKRGGTYISCALFLGIGFGCQVISYRGAEFSWLDSLNLPADMIWQFRTTSELAAHLSRLTNENRDTKIARRIRQLDWYRQSSDHTVLDKHLRNCNEQVTDSTVRLMK